MLFIALLLFERIFQCLTWKFTSKMGWQCGVFLILCLFCDQHFNSPLEWSVSSPVPFILVLPYACYHKMFKFTSLNCSQNVWIHILLKISRDHRLYHHILVPQIFFCLEQFGFWDVLSKFKVPNLIVVK